MFASFVNMKKFAVFMLIMLASLTFAHEEVMHTTPEEEFAHSFDENAMLASIYGFGLLLLITLLTIHFKKKLKEKHKKMIFSLIVIIVTIITLFLAIGTIYLNIISESGGPVHWHADFEISVCGEKQELPTSVRWCELTEKSPFCGITNRVGTSVFHHHDDYRIHVEGVVVKYSDVNLGNFFRVIGGNLNEDSVSIPQNDGSVKTYVNGDVCPNGEKGKVRVFVDKGGNENYVENFEYGDYLMSPYSTVPPGDNIKIVFGE